MNEFREEIDQHFSSFTTAWHSEQETVETQLQKNQFIYKNSYARLVSLNIWREQLLSQRLRPEALAFFLEAQNDALVSHVFAAKGAWRASLQSLRAFLENAVFCMFFKDHPVELELWHIGKYKPGFADTKEYLSRHPRYFDLDASLTGISMLGAEYATLSKAVHGVTSFRMTISGDETLLWSSDRANLGAWATREANAVRAVNLILLVMFSPELQGAAFPLLRKAASLAVPFRYHSSIKKKLGITLYKP